METLPIISNNAMVLLSPPNHEDSTPCISFHSLSRQMIPSTLKLAGIINRQNVVVLISNSSTNNLIQNLLATHLSLIVYPSPHMRVIVRNGESLGYGNDYHDVPHKLGDTLFQVELLLLPIYRVNLVLGVFRISPTMFDYRNLWMEITHNGSSVRLHGLIKPSLHYITPFALTKQI